MGDVVNFGGLLRGHNGWVTSIATTSESSNMLVSGSRDKTVMIWDLTRNENDYGFAKKALKGHSHFVQDVIISSDGQFALSASWDSTLRLWDLNAGNTTRRFVGHTKDVLSVAFSYDNRQIISGSRDRSIKLWNTLAEKKFDIDNGHKDWVSCVRFSQNPSYQIFVSGSWDKTVKVWSLNGCALKHTLTGHTGYVNSVAISPDGSLCASGGRDGTCILWDLHDGKELYKLESGNTNSSVSTINTLCFSPNKYWLCAGTDSGLKIWDLESRNLIANIDETHPDFQPQEKSKKPAVISLAWSNDGQTLFAGYTDNVIRVWNASHSQ